MLSLSRCSRHEFVIAPSFMSLSFLESSAQPGEVLPPFYRTNDVVHIAADTSYAPGLAGVTLRSHGLLGDHRLIGQYVFQAAQAAGQRGRDHKREQR